MARRYKARRYKARRYNVQLADNCAQTHTFLMVQIWLMHTGSFLAGFDRSETTFLLAAPQSSALQPDIISACCHTVTVKLMLTAAGAPKPHK